jgi:hypothetical protein
MVETVLSLAVDGGLSFIERRVGKGCTEHLVMLPLDVAETLKSVAPPGRSIDDVASGLLARTCVDPWLSDQIVAQAGTCSPPEGSRLILLKVCIVDEHLAGVRRLAFMLNPAASADVARLLRAAVCVCVREEQDDPFDPYHSDGAFLRAMAASARRGIEARAMANITIALPAGWYVAASDHALTASVKFPELTAAVLHQVVDKSLAQISALRITPEFGCPAPLPAHELVTENINVAVTRHTYDFIRRESRRMQVSDSDLTRYLLLDARVIVMGCNRTIEQANWMRSADVAQLTELLCALPSLVDHVDAEPDLSAEPVPLPSSIASALEEAAARTARPIPEIYARVFSHLAQLFTTVSLPERIMIENCVHLWARLLEKESRREMPVPNTRHAAARQSPQARTLSGASDAALLGGIVAVLLSAEGVVLA